MKMHWLAYVIIGVVVLTALILLKGAAPVSAEKLRNSLKQGAIVIDVRTEEEYRQDHIAGTTNIPLQILKQSIERHAPDKRQPILLHCRSGGRSGMAKTMLESMGYQNCSNLGSLERARSILTQQEKSEP